MPEEKTELEKLFVAIESIIDNMILTERNRMDSVIDSDDEELYMSVMKECRVRRRVFRQWASSVEELKDTILTDKTIWKEEEDTSASETEDTGVYSHDTDKSIVEKSYTEKPESYEEPETGTISEHETVASVPVCDKNVEPQTTEVKDYGEMVRTSMRRLADAGHRFPNYIVDALNYPSRSYTWFGIDRAFFSDSYINGKYWEEPFRFNGRNFYIANEWDEKCYNKFKEWYSSLKINPPEPANEKTFSDKDTKETQDDISVNDLISKLIRMSEEMIRSDPFKIKMVPYKGGYHLRKHFFDARYKEPLLRPYKLSNGMQLETYGTADELKAVIREFERYFGL